jgi:carbon-monoxide dehydrogenase small subunit
LLAVSADGAIVDTVEGMATDDELSPVQQAFWDEYGFQCGYCLPGMLFSAQDLLSRNPRPGDEDIRDAISGNLCRCTGYHGIVRAVRQAATNLAGDGRVGGGEDVERVAEKTPGLGTGQATKQDDAGRPPTG